MTALVEDAAAGLRAAGVGEVLASADSGYDAHRRVWNAAVDRRPAVIARCRTVDEVVAAVTVARDRGLPVSVRGGGHGIAGQAVADGALLLDLSPMREFTVDPRRRLARVGPGVTWARLDRATSAHGLATTGADVSSVGVIGTALVGGCGWLHRRDGATCDRLRRLEVVTAAGERREVTPDREPDLWWALRGGGGGLAAVTSAELALGEVREVHAGTVLYPARDAAAVLAGYRRVCGQAPDELSLQAALLRWPPGAPEGPPVVAVSVAWFGPAERAAEAVAPVRRLGAVELDLVRPLSYVELQGQSEHAFPAGYGTATDTEWLRELDDAAIGALVAAAERMPTPVSMISLHQLGGAMGRVDEAATAFARRGAAQHLAVFSCWPPGGSPQPSRRWASAVVASVAACSAGGPYLALLDAEVPAERVRRAFPEPTRRRLLDVKRRHDPDDLFRFGLGFAPERYADGC
jgi:FAD/FMN-containing dehydrogenase